MDFLEKDLEEILYRADPVAVKERGLHCFEHDTLLRQFCLGSYGIIDLLGIRGTYNGHRSITIYELKNKTIDAAAFWQLMRYMRGLEHFIDSKMNVRPHKYYIHGVLIGKTIDTSGEVCYMPDIMGNVSMYTYSYSLTGMRFNCESGFKLTNPGKVNTQKHGFSLRDLIRITASVPKTFPQGNEYDF